MMINYRQIIQEEFNRAGLVPTLTEVASLEEKFVDRGQHPDEYALCAAVWMVVSDFHRKNYPGRSFYQMCWEELEFSDEDMVEVVPLVLGLLDPRETKLHVAKWYFLSQLNAWDMIPQLLSALQGVEPIKSIDDHLTEEEMWDIALRRLWSETSPTAMFYMRSKEEAPSVVEERQELGLSRAEMAEHLGIPYYEVFRAEEGLTSELDYRFAQGTKHQG